MSFFVHTRILRHANVLSLRGVVSTGPSLQVMLEYCSLGNFKTFLVTKRKDAAMLLGNGMLLRMATDMASGLCYLHSMSIAHKYGCYILEYLNGGMYTYSELPPLK